MYGHGLCVLTNAHFRAIHALTRVRKHIEFVKDVEGSSKVKK